MTSQEGDSVTGNGVTGNYVTGNDVTGNNVMGSEVREVGSGVRHRCAAAAAMSPLCRCRRCHIHSLFLPLSPDSFNRILLSRLLPYFSPLHIAFFLSLPLYLPFSLSFILYLLFSLSSI